MWVQLSPHTLLPGLILLGGEFAPKGSEFCPLNVCCSQFGFCGTGHDFCSGKCQSNCVQKPTVPPGRNSGSVLNKVIGYYEGWWDWVCVALLLSVMTNRLTSQVHVAAMPFLPAQFQPRGLHTSTLHLPTLIQSHTRLPLWSLICPVLFLTKQRALGRLIRMRMMLKSLYP